MGDTVLPTETANQEPLKNEAQNQPAPQQPQASPVVNEMDGEVERLRKEAEKAKMEANLFRNKLEAEEKAKAEAEAKKLEDNNEFKTLYEQEAARRKALEEEVSQKQKDEELRKAKDTVFADYSEEVRVLAEEAGMALQDTDEQSVASFKEKLDKIGAMLPSNQVSPNNPNPTVNKPAPSSEELHEILRDETKFHEFVTERFPGIAAMTKQNPPQ